MSIRTVNLTSVVIPVDALAAESGRRQVREIAPHLCQRVECRLEILEAPWTSGFGPGEFLDDALEIGIERHAPGAMS